uniref:Putative secreted peptide n=1 Tax=Anopheles braziliensis TaxID=58242 RepID=A0A2M3ZN29_9DIPT
MVYFHRCLWTLTGAAATTATAAATATAATTTAAADATVHHYYSRGGPRGIDRVRPHSTSTFHHSRRCHGGRR